MAIAPTLRSSNSLPAGTGATSRTVNTPAGVADYDVMLAGLVIETTQNPVTGLVAPAGWDLLLDHYSGLVAGQEGHVLIYSTRAMAEGPSHTWSWTSLLWSECTMTAHYGCPLSGPYVDSVSAATPVNGTSIDWSSNTLGDATRLVFFLRQFNAGAFTGPGTEVFDGGTTLETACYDVAGPATAGPTGTKTFTSAGSGQFQAVGVALSSVAGDRRNLPSVPFMSNRRI